MKNDRYIDILEGYISSIFQNFESRLRTEVDLIEDDIRLVLHEYSSSFITCKNFPDLYTFKNLSEVIFKNLLSEFEGVNNVIDFENDGIGMKTKLVVRSGIIAIGLMKNHFSAQF